MSDQEATRTIQAVMPLAATLGIRAEVYSPDEVALSMDWSPSLCTANGILHGGVIMALADSAGAACAMLIESKTNFVGAVSKGTVSATSTPLHRGGTTIVVETVVHAEAGKLVAKVTQTQLVLRR